GTGGGRLPGRRGGGCARALPRALLLPRGRPLPWFSWRRRLRGARRRGPRGGRAGGLPGRGRRGGGGRGRGGALGGHAEARHTEGGEDEGADGPHTPS